MKSKLSKKEAKEKIDGFFERSDFTPEEVNKIKKLAMKHRIRLGNYRKRFCKRCLSKLRGKTRVTKFYKIILCDNCGYRNRFKITQRS